MWVGIDENGLGPRLGPLIVTACAIDCGPDLRTASLQAKAMGIADSKEIAGFGRMGQLESLVLALLEAHFGKAPRHGKELFALLSIEPVSALQLRCPDSLSKSQCWTLASLPALGGELDRGRVLLRTIEAPPLALRMRWAASAIACPKRINQARSQGQSKLDLLLELVERLLLASAARLGTPIHATCGRIGAIRTYVPRFRFLSKNPCEVLEENPTSSRYRIEGLGLVEFLVDAEAHSPAVALASMIGKYLRELMMSSIVSFYRSLDPTLQAVSGYRDPLTARFVEATRAHRIRLKVLDECFER
ncbi:MAG: hypothetical protein NZM37_02290 [Sandaracinaceae bacterium]|nr:hypothetical protein [Sandaracinaceae bacterium]